MLVNLQGPWSLFAGRLGILLELQYDNPFIMFALALVVAGGITICGWLTYKRAWGWLWREWLTTVDHKKIGIMYFLLGLVMMFRGFFDALMIRTSQAIAAGPGAPGFLDATHGYLPPFHIDQLFAVHGTIMIILAVTPMLFGLMNLIVPIQINARDMAYPFLNAIGLAMTAAATALVMVSLFVGYFSHDAWIGLAPLTELRSSPGVGVDYWIWALQISTVGTTLGAINLIATILKMRGPGMRLMRMPIFSWTSLCTSILALTSFPLLTVALALLTCDRYIGTHFFTAGFGGDFMMYTNLFWIWGHPEVYFVVMPAFGMISEIVPVFSEKKLFGYTSMVLATMGIAGASWLVWMHHFLTMGQTAAVNSFFSVASMLVGIPTGVKVFNWLFTTWRGRVRFESPMLWAMAATALLIGGGMTGMMVAIPAINYVTHNSVFVVAHFHNMFLVIAFAIFGGFFFWFPKAYGFKFDKQLSRTFFWLFWAGSVFVFVPMYALGFLGMTRRLAYIPNADMSWQILLYAEAFGIALYSASIACFVLLLYVSIRDRAINRVRTTDAWGTSRSLEWLTHTPPPAYNFAVLPVVHAQDEWAWRREHGLTSLRPERYTDIHMPRNSAIPVLLCAFVSVLGFALVWRIWWLAAAALFAVVVSLVWRAFTKDVSYVIPAAEVERMESGFLLDEAQAAKGSVWPAQAGKVSDPAS